MKETEPETTIIMEPCPHCGDEPWPITSFYGYCSEDCFEADQREPNFRSQGGDV